MFRLLDCSIVSRDQLRQLIEGINVLLYIVSGVLEKNRITNKSFDGEQNLKDREKLNMKINCTDKQWPSLYVFIPFNSLTPDWINCSLGFVCIGKAYTDNRLIS